MNHEFNDPIAALRQELSSVTVPPEFGERVRERLADDLEPLRAELADLTVSPEFAVRVRQTAEGQARAWRFTWRWAAPVAGLAAAAIVAIAFWPRPAVAPTAPSPITTVTRIEPPLEAGSSDPARRRAHSSSSIPASPRDPMLEVITDQPELLRRLWVRVDSGVAVDPTEPAGIYQAPKLEVTPIEVSPIVTFLVPDLRAPIGVTPIILRMTADSAERSSK